MIAMLDTRLRPEYRQTMRRDRLQTAAFRPHHTMKRLFSSPDSAEVGLLSSRLESAGIPCELRNEFLTQAMPGAPFDSEVWVLDDENYREASELLAAWRRPPSSGATEQV